MTKQQIAKHITQQIEKTQPKVRCTKCDCYCTTEVTGRSFCCNARVEVSK